MKPIVALIFTCSLSASPASHAEWALDFNSRCALELPCERFDIEITWSDQLEGENAVAVRAAPDPPSTERSLITSRVGRASGRINTANLARGLGSSVEEIREYGRRNAGSGVQSKDEVVFDRNKGALYALYGRALRDHPTLEGKVVFEFDINMTGIVTRCRIKSSTLNAPDLEASFCARIRVIRFRARDAPETLVKQMDFFPAA